MSLDASTAPSARPSFSGRWRRFFYSMRTEGEGHEAASIGTGLFIGCLPLFGLHLALVIVIGKLLRLNRLQMYLAANISNPLMAPFLLLLEAQTGAWIRRDAIHQFTLESLRTTSLWTIAGDLAVGSVIVGMVLGAGAALVTQAIVYAGREASPLFTGIARDASARFLAFSITSWEVARAKLSADRVYRTALLEGLIPPGASVLDVGCGRGLMLAVLAEARRRVASGADGAHDLPRLASLTGIELRPRIAALARNALGEDATIVVADVKTAAVQPVDAILVFDVLHMLPYEEQMVVARQLVEALAPGGVLLLREADAGGGWRFRLVRFGNRVHAILTGRWRQPLCFRSMAQWRVLFEQMGLHAAAAPSAANELSANRLFVLRRAPSPGHEVRADAHELAHPPA
jgi:uncharacterized protein (DUF2062 family)/SAM-dependent methyltransferase